MTSELPITTLPFEQNGHQFTRRETLRVLELEGGPPYVMDLPHECRYCAEYPKVSVEDRVVRAEGPCSQPHGITTVITLEVPSGRMLVTDDLRPMYRVDEDELASYNTALGQAQHTHAMAAVGCAYGAVGNTCPGLYRTGEDTYVIANPAYDEETDETHLEGGELLAGIITDLWAYSIADYDDWKSRGGDESALGWSDTVVDVTPGTYRFTHHTGERDFDAEADGVTVYAHVERIA